jgi:hypothetical protein
MKKIIIILIFLAIISPVFAQNNSGDGSSMYYFNVSVERIFPSSEGYIVQYRKNVFELATIGIPNSWFNEAGGRAELIRLPGGANWPSMSVFYNNGEFSHVRLYIHRNRSHETWGNIPMGADVSRHFMDAESFRLEF